jgi:hypothetical protein
LSSDLEVSGTGAQSHALKVTVNSHVEWPQADTKVLTPYAGERGGIWTAHYLPDQTGYGNDIDFTTWQTKIEASCGTQPGCHSPAGKPCGAGDYWTCDQCFGATCLLPSFVYECDPPINPAP